MDSPTAELLVATLVLTLSMLPAMDALRTGILGSGVDESLTVAHVRLRSKMEEVLAQPYTDLTSAEVAAAGGPSTYSDVVGTPTADSSSCIATTATTRMRTAIPLPVRTRVFSGYGWTSGPHPTRSPRWSRNDGSDARVRKTSFPWLHAARAPRRARGRIASPGGSERGRGPVAANLECRERAGKISRSRRALPWIG